MDLPERIRDAAHLDDLLSEPSAAAIDGIRAADGDILVLGAGGKMGPTLARMARRAMDAAGLRFRTIAVARFSSSELRRTLEAAIVCRRYRKSRIVAFSTGNVYRLVPRGRGGSREDDVPVGEYAMSW